jgi:5'(3')-deoxyribonucleotidase
MKKKRIGIDMDQVIADIMSEWLRRYNNDYNDNLSPKDITEWNFHNIVKPECGKKIYTYLDDPDLFRNLPVIDESQDAVYELSKNYEIFIITAPFNPNNILPKYDWLKKNFNFISEKNYVFTRNKSIANTNWLIDDNPDNFIGYSGEPLLYNAPHNKSYQGDILRFDNWQEIVFYFDWIQNVQEELLSERQKQVG